MAFANIEKLIHDQLNALVTKHVEMANDKLRLMMAAGIPPEEISVHTHTPAGTLLVAYDTVYFIIERPVIEASLN